MRKIYPILTIIFLFATLTLLIHSSSKSASAAGCSLSSNPATVDPNFNGSVTLTSATDCFNTNVTYMATIHPQSKDGNSGLYANYAMSDNKPQDARTLPIKLDLTRMAIGRDNPGTWIARVCLPGGLISTCTPGSSIEVGSATITVSSSPTPTPTPVPANLPQIAAPLTCVYQAGSPVSFAVVNAIPNTYYNWWWAGDIGVKSPMFRSNSSGDLSVNIPGQETQSGGDKTFCIDIEAQRRCNNYAQNSLKLRFTPTQPTGDTSCSTLNAPPGGTTGGGPAFQIDYCDPAKTVVNTAIGCIPTEPGGFVSFMFKYLLGFSGMIAFFLILAAGFQILTSAGNPEKLQAGQQLLTAAVIGVMVLVFSIVILQIIGTNILGGLPGFPEFRRGP